MRACVHSHHSPSQALQHKAFWSIGPSNPQVFSSLSPISKKIDHIRIVMHRSAIARASSLTRSSLSVDIESPFEPWVLQQIHWYTIVSSQTTVYNLFDTQADLLLISFNVLPRHNTRYVIVRCTINQTPYFRSMRFRSSNSFLKSKSQRTAIVVAKLCSCCRCSKVSIRLIKPLAPSFGTLQDIYLPLRHLNHLSQTVSWTSIRGLYLITQCQWTFFISNFKSCCSSGLILTNLS